LVQQRVQDSVLRTEQSRVHLCHLLTDQCWIDKL